MSSGQLYRAIRERVARYHFVVDGDQPSLDESLENRRREFQLRCEVVDCRPMWARYDEARTAGILVQMA